MFIPSSPSPSFRYGTASVCGGLFLPGRTQVQIPGDEGAGSVAAGAVRGSAGVPLGRGGPTLGELQQGAATSQQDPDAGARQPPAGLPCPPAESCQPGLSPASETQASRSQSQRGELTPGERQRCC